jgi:hypothetical protein
VQQELAREETEEWNTKLDISGTSGTGLLTTQQPTMTKCTAMNTYKTWQSKLSLIAESNMLYRNAREIKLTAMPKGTTQTDQYA